MSSGTFSLRPGAPNPSIDAQSFAGGIVAGAFAPASTAVASLVGDLAARVRQAPTITIQLAYMRAARDFCLHSMWLRRSIPSAAVTIGQPLYNFGADATLEVLQVPAAAIQQQNTTWIDIYPADQSTFDPNQKNDIPQWFSYVPENMLVLYPTPNYAYNLRVSLICQTAINATTVPNDLISKFNLYLEEGAMSYLYLMDKEPWYNPELAVKAEMKFWEGIGIARSWKDKGNQMASVRATPRTFIAR